MLSSNEYELSARSLTIFGLQGQHQIQIVTEICPEENTALEGLYRSSSMYCTQCEAEGFRKITYYQDRPDVLAKFRTTIVADAQRYPNCCRTAIWCTRPTCQTAGAKSLGRPVS